MAKDLGNQVDKIGGNVFLLALQALFFFLIGAAVAYFVFFRGVVSADTTTLDPLIFNLIVYAVILFTAFMGLWHIFKIARNKIAVHEEGLVIQGAFSTTEIPYDNIDHFEWITQTTRMGFIPIARSYHVHIVGRTQAVIATVDSAQYSKMRKKMESLEEKLGI